MPARFINIAPGDADAFAGGSARVSELMAPSSAAAGRPKRVLIDRGHLNRAAFARVRESGVEIHVAVAAEAALARRRYEFRPADRRRGHPREPSAPLLIAMKEKLASEEGRALHARRQAGVEPVFGIIKGGARGPAVFAARRAQGWRRMDAGDAGLQLQTDQPPAPGKLEPQSLVHGAPPATEAFSQARAQLAPSFAPAPAPHPQILRPAGAPIAPRKCDRLLASAHRLILRIIDWIELLLGTIAALRPPLASTSQTSVAFSHLIAYASAARRFSTDR